MDRSTFIKQSSLITASVFASPYFKLKSQAKLSVVLIGSGWWGFNILREAIKSGEITVAALCDVDSRQLTITQEEVSKISSDRPKLFKDYRECIRTIKPDIAIIATPDHWHALCAIEAMKNGAHIFLEKPIAHTQREGLAIYKTALDTQSVVAVDFHRRYSAHNKSAHDFLMSGKLGQIKQINAFVNYNYPMGSKETSIEPPKELDWDFYCGPGQLVPYLPQMHIRGWRQFENFGNGQLGDWGPHWFDQILWWSEEKTPKKIYSTKKQPNIRNSNFDTPERQTVVYEFEQFNLTWDHSIINQHPNENHNVGIYFHGTGGTLHLGWLDGWTFYSSNKKEPVLKEKADLNSPDMQNIDAVWADFISCIRKKDGTQPLAGIKEGHYATNMALLGMAAMRHGSDIVWDGEKEIITNDKSATKWLSRNYRQPWDYPKF